MGAFYPRPWASTGDYLMTQSSHPPGMEKCNPRLARGISRPHATSLDLNWNDSIYHSSHFSSKLPPPTSLPNCNTTGAATGTATKPLLGASRVPTNPSSIVVESVNTE
ncbi:hypothetical protein B296_00053957 [Ensete ventricosum]|uniref:Uncharacterized protein n=1 Tax=Ensete ventricosum TaxID=4639 RepID=A0A426XDL0_ENSVE|nr:hypothetical protein B296_00053957 [Ensete ventricosum]